MLKKRIDSFRFAIKGLARLVQTQPNARIHLVAALGVLVGGLYFGLSTLEWIACVFAIAMVLSAEAFNTALEDLTDLVSPDYHPLAGHAKDVAAAAVLIVAIGAAIIGCLIFVPKIITLLN